MHVPVLLCVCVCGTRLSASACTRMCVCGMCNPAQVHVHACACVCVCRHLASIIISDSCCTYNHSILITIIFIMIIIHGFF